MVKTYLLYNHGSIENVPETFISSEMIIEIAEDVEVITIGRKGAPGGHLP